MSRKEGKKRQRSPQPPEDRGRPKARTISEAIRSAQYQLAILSQKCEKASGRKAEILLELQLEQQKELVLLRQQELQRMQTYNLQSQSWWTWIRSLLCLRATDATSGLNNYNIITPAELLRVKAASFALISTSIQKGSQIVQPECTGFFIAERIAVTALHALSTSRVGDIFTARFKGRALGPARDIAVHVVKVVQELDIAYLGTAEVQSFIQLLELDPSLLPQLKVGLASFNFSLEDSQLGTVRIIAGTILDVDEEAGTLEHTEFNSGATLIVAQGKVVAMHTEGDNRLKKLNDTASLRDIRRQVIEIERGFVMGGHGILASNIRDNLPE